VVFRVLVVDDDPALCETLEAGLTPRGYRVATRPDAAGALAELAHADFDAVITDIGMAGLSGIDLCRRIVADHPEVPVIIITGFGTMENAIAAMEAGAHDLLVKPFELDALELSLERAGQHRLVHDPRRRLPRALVEAPRFEELLAASQPMRRVCELLGRVAVTDASVLLTGESGTGKELAARALHRRSARSGGPFVAISLGAVPETLLESELFGHEKGAYTDATSTRAGLFMQADGGTLFLDEIGEMPLGLQPKLLRVLQERRVRAVGGDEETPFDVRLVAASNADLQAAVQGRRFREDLLYRIEVVHVHLPPLRSRGSDVLLLAQHFVEHFATSLGKAVAGMTREVAGRLLGYPWPGNVRELQNCVEHAVALATGEVITVDDLPEKVQRYRASPAPPPLAAAVDLAPLEEVERRHVLRVLEAVGGNKTLAAQILRLDRKTLYRKLQRYGVWESTDEIKL
jgi:two-component system response regulator AtoC